MNLNVCCQYQFFFVRSITANDLVQILLLLLLLLLVLVLVLHPRPPPSSSPPWAAMDTTAKWLRARVSECTAQEISGALGDVGLFVTILVALARELQLSIGSTLLFSGFYNVATGVLLAAPVPVQPMKVCVCVHVCVCVCVCVCMCV